MGSVSLCYSIAESAELLLLMAPESPFAPASAEEAEDPPPPEEAFFEGAPPSFAGFFGEDFLGGEGPFGEEEAAAALADEEGVLALADGEGVLALAEAAPPLGDDLPAGASAEDAAAGGRKNLFSWSMALTESWEDCLREKPTAPEWTMETETAWMQTPQYKAAVPKVPIHLVPIHPTLAPIHLVPRRRNGAGRVWEPRKRAARQAESATNRFHSTWEPRKQAAAAAITATQRPQLGHNVAYPFKSLDSIPHRHPQFFRNAGC